MTVAPKSIQASSSKAVSGQDSLNLSQWLSALKFMLPFSQLTLLGAGRGYSEVLTWAAEHAIEKISLVEANPQRFRQLDARWKTAHQQWQLHNLVMDSGMNTNTFFVASNSDESGLLNPEELTPLWPNITETEIQCCEPASIAEWSSTHWQNPGQWLFIEYFCNANLLTSYAAEFEKIDVLQVRVSTEKSLPKIVTARAWEAVLEKAGFRIISRECERSPHVERWLCIKQHNREVEAVKNLLNETQARLAQATKSLERSHNQIIDYEERAKSLKNKIASLENDFASVEKEMIELRQHSSQWRMTRESLDKISQQITENFAIQSIERRQTANALGQHVTKISKELKLKESLKKKDSL